MGLHYFHINNNKRSYKLWQTYGILKYCIILKHSLRVFSSSSLKEILPSRVQFQTLFTSICRRISGQPSVVTWDSNFSGSEAVASTASNALGFIADKAGGRAIGTISGHARNVLDMLAGGGHASDLVQLNQGVMANPYLAQIFRGVNFRNFSFSFRLVPLSEDDCDIILDIIKTFRKHALPSGPEGRSNVAISKLS